MKLIFNSNLNLGSNIKNFFSRR